MQILPSKLRQIIGVDIILTEKVIKGEIFSGLPLRFKIGRHEGDQQDTG